MWSSPSINIILSLWKSSMRYSFWSTPTDILSVFLTLLFHTFQSVFIPIGMKRIMLGTLDFPLSHVIRRFLVRYWGGIWYVSFCKFIQCGKNIHLPIVPYCDYTPILFSHRWVLIIPFQILQAKITPAYHSFERISRGYHKQYCYENFLELDHESKLWI